MSIQENKQLVLEGYKRFQTGDIRGVLERYHDSADWVAPENEYLTTSGSYHGKAGIAEFFTRLAQTVQLQHMDIKQVIAEGDTVVVTGDSSWLALNTGRKYDNPFVHVFTIRDGKVARTMSYYDTAIAERALNPDAQLSSGIAPHLHH